ncbi:MAG: hypothetical protein Q8K98_13410 [Bacteroidota bacterium]|nr:hypothetical protein [Bacteroidota bacterium]
MPVAKIHKIEGPLIFDASAIFNFGHRGELVNILEKLKQQFKLLTTYEVYKQCLIKLEYIDYYQNIIKNYFKIGSGKPPENMVDTLKKITKKLGNADVSILILALDTKGTVVIDEKASRKEAKNLGLKIIGTLGLIHYSVEKGWISETESMEKLNKLRNRGFRIPDPIGMKSMSEYLKRLEDY